MFYRWMVLGSLGLALACGSAKPVENAVTPAPARELPAVLRQFDATHRTLMYFADPMPYMQRVLQNPALRREAAAGPIAAMSPDQSLDLDAWWATVSEAQRWIPEEAAIGFTTESAMPLSRLLRIILLLDLCEAARQIESDDFVELQRALVEEMEGFELSGVSAWVRFRDEETAKELFEQVRQTMSTIQADGVIVETSERAVTLSLALSGYVKDAWRVFWLQSMGLISGEEDPMAQRLFDVTGQLGLDMELEHRGRDLGIRVGPAANTRAPVLRASELGPLFHSAPESMAMWMRWDVEVWKKEAARTQTIVERWQGTPVGHASRANEDIIGDFADMADIVVQTATYGEMVLDANSPLRVVSEQRAFQPVPALSTFAPFLPRIPEAPMVVVDASRSFADVLSEMMANVEQRMARESLKSTLSDDTDREALYERMSQVYYDKFATLRGLVRERAKEVFAPPSGVVMTLDGTVDTLDVAISGMPVMGAKELPIVEFAIIGKAESQTQAIEFIKLLYTALNGGLAAIGDREAPAAEQVMHSTDLGFAVPTYDFSAPWIGFLSQDRLSITVTGDFHPHIFVLDDYLVFSTSPGLSRRIAASNTEGAERAHAQSWREQISHGRFTGASFAGLFQIAEIWSTKLFGNDPDTERVLQGLARLMQFIDYMEWSSRDDGDVRKSKFELVFTEPDASPAP